MIIFEKVRICDGENIPHIPNLDLYKYDDNFKLFNFYIQYNYLYCSIEFLNDNIKYNTFDDGLYRKLLYSNDRLVTITPIIKNSLLCWDLLIKEEEFEPFGNGDKLFHIDCYFRLPKKFNGDVNDALTELLKYKKMKKDKQEFVVDNDLSIYDNWFEMVTTTNLKLLGNTSISELVDDEFKSII